MNVRPEVVCCAAALVFAAGCASGSSTGAQNSSPADPATTQTAQQPAGVAIRSANPPHRIAESPVTPASGAATLQAARCATRDVTLKVGGDNGDFNGMSHSGTYLTLTNKSRNACSVPGLPQLTFVDANGPVKTTADLPGAKFMHPGPVVLPMVLQPKQSVTTSARWVSGPVYQDNLCYKLTGVTLALLGDGSAMAPLTGQMCGERSKGVHYDLQRYGANAK